MSLEIYVLVWDMHKNVAGFVYDTCMERFSYILFRIVCRCSLDILRNEINRRFIFPPSMIIKLFLPLIENKDDFCSQNFSFKVNTILSLTGTYFYLPIQSYKMTRNVSSFSKRVNNSSVIVMADLCKITVPQLNACIFPM